MVAMEAKNVLEGGLEGGSTLCISLAMVKIVMYLTKDVVGMVLAN